jgi:hypothetical protein
MREMLAVIATASDVRLDALHGAALGMPSAFSVLFYSFTLSTDKDRII